MDGIIFSDLDDTFLDAQYRPAFSPDEFRAVLARWTVVWVSSRTAEELLMVQARVQHDGDAIGENGGVLVTRARTRAQALGEPEAVGGAWVVRLASPRATTLARVRGAFADAGAPATTLDDLGAEELARRSAYTLEDAERALQRRASVMLAGVDPADARVARALAALRRAGATVVHGGRWTSVVHGADKGTAVRAWLGTVARETRARPSIVAGIGNADNDAALLRAVDHAFVIRAPDGTHAPSLAAVPGARLLQQRGTAGWREMHAALAAQLEGA